MSRRPRRDRPSCLTCRNHRLTRTTRSQSYNQRMAAARISDWIGWYRFARDRFGYSHGEAVVYANLRQVEDENHEALKRRVG